MWTTTALRCGQNKMFSCIVPNRVHICTRVYIYSHSGSNPLTNLWNQSESGLSSSLRVRFSVSWQLLETYVPRRAGYVLYISSYPLFVHTILDTCIVAKLKLTFCLCCFTVILMCELSSKSGVNSCDESVVWIVSMVSRQVKLPPCFLNIFRHLQQVMWVYTGTGITCSHSKYKSFGHVTRGSRTELVLVDVFFCLCGPEIVVLKYVATLTGFTLWLSTRLWSKWLL